MRPLEPIDLVIPPGADELPHSDGEPLESNRHALQMMLLRALLERHLAARRADYFVGMNMFLYYSILQTKKNDFRGPDVFVALGVPHRDRKSWVMWEEDGRAPDVIFELTSESTADEDRGAKMRVYAMLRIPEYFIYDPLTGALDGFHIDPNQSAYHPISPTASGRLPSGVLGVELGISDVPFSGFPGPWLRCFTPEGALIPLAEEAEAEERRLREEERRLREEAERKLADAMAELARLRTP